MANLLNKKISLTKPAIKQPGGFDNPAKANNQLLEFFINNYQLFIGLICLLVMVGSLFGFFLPQYRQTLAESNDNYQRAQQELADKQRYQASLIKLNDFYKRIDQNTRSKVMDILPVTLDKENLLAEIEAICLTNSLLIKSSDVASRAESETSASSTVDITSLKSRLRTAIIKLELQGKNYQSFKGLLKTIENNLHLMDILRLDYSPGKNQIILEIQVYYLSD